MEKYNKLNEVMKAKGYTVTVDEDYEAFSYENGKHRINYYTNDGLILALIRPNGKSTLEKITERELISYWFDEVVKENVEY